jgi:primosomal protein N' (replication factor Y)
MEKKAGKFRYHLIVQAENRRALHICIQQLIQIAQHSEWQNKVRWSVDIDPLDLTW